jgi:hypothetical protein
MPLLLQRIYGTAWESAEQLSAYQALKAEAARRDHRKLGQELDLFSIQDSAGGRTAALRLQESAVAVTCCRHCRFTLVHAQVQA